MIDEWGKGAKYWDKAWNPMIGCKKCSPGCEHCYAARMAERYPELRDADGGFTPHPPKTLKTPPKSGVVFVGNMTDIFGEWNDWNLIVNWLMSLNDHAETLLLTKRAERMERLIANIDPFCRAWWGITAENQDKLSERAPHLMRTGRYIQKWASLEPLIGPVNIAPYLLTEHQKRGFDNQYIPPEHNWQYYDKFDWVVVGAESGENRRPCKLEWVRQIVEDCQEWGVPVFVKQLEIDGKLVKDINLFPEDLQIRQVPWKGGAK